jgi:leucyl aminopeptidase
LPLTVRAGLLAWPGAAPIESFLPALLAGEAEPPDLLAFPVPADQGTAADGAEPGGAALSALLPVPGRQLLAAYGHDGQPGEVAESAITVAGRVVRVLLLGFGDQSPTALRRAGAALGRRCADGKVAVVDLTGVSAGEGIAALTEGVLLGGYRFRLRGGLDGPHAAQPQPDVGEVRLLVPDATAARPLVSRAETIASAVATARDLANAPSAGKSPQWLAAEARRLTEGREVAVRVWSEDELADAGFGGILAVGSGSVRPPRLIELSYRPAGAQRHVVLVGKGITFDSGGLSLKPNDNMKLMKTDMAGGGAVIAVLSELAALGVRCQVTGLVAAAENMPSGSAYRPGDVISQYGGTSVEVLNTDAEGRLVLADALAYAIATLAPDQIVDIATLTGAARVALGGTHAAVYATCDSLAESLLAAGVASGDLLWRMPLEDGYRPALDSDVADLAHVATDHNPAGSIVAALFLREFTGGTPWAHLDIAGPARSTADDGEVSKGGTGFGTRLLLSWLTSQPA